MNFNWQIILLLTLLTPHSSSAPIQNAPLSTEKKSVADTDWTKNTECGVPFWIAWNDVSRDRPPASRTIYIFIEPQNCTRDNFKRIFLYLTEKYPLPENLHIIARSDKLALQNRAYGVGWDEEGYHVEEIGFYRAQYARNLVSSGFDFTPDPNKTDTVIIAFQEHTQFLPPKGITYTPTGDKNFDLVLASFLGKEDAVKRLLADGADVNGRTEHGNTALLVAITLGERKIIRLLLDAGADVNQKDPDGWTALMYALAYSFREGNVEMAEELLRRGGDINARAANGDTALLYAVKSWKDLTKMVEQLLRKGADVNVKDQDGRSLLMIAEEKGRPDSLRILIKEAMQRKQ